MSKIRTNASETVKAVLKETGTTQVSLGKRVGEQQRSIAVKLLQGNMTIGTLVNWMTAVGYKVVVIPDSGRTPKNGYVIEKTSDKE